MDDVRPAAELTVPPDARRVRFETFAGGAVDVTLTDLGEGETAKHWLTIKVTGKLGEPTDAVKPSDQSPAAAGPQARRLGVHGSGVPGGAFAGGTRPTAGRAITRFLSLAVRVAWIRPRRSSPG